MADLTTEDTRGPSLASQPPDYFLSGKKVIVSGAGIGGLAFAIALHRQWDALSVRGPFPTVAIYERETQANAIGREGYSMSIRGDPPGGVQALQRLGALEAMTGVAISAADATQNAGFCLWEGPSGRLLMKMRAKVPEGLPVGGLRIARNKLRGEMLAAATKAGCSVVWGAGCLDVARRERDSGGDGRLQVTLMDGRTDDCDVFVAADGANSKIRQQLRPDDGLVPTGIAMIGGEARFGNARPPSPVHRDWGSVLIGKGIGLFASPVDQHSALWAVSFATEKPREDKRQPLPDVDAQALLAEARGYAPLMPPWFGKLLDATDPKKVGLMNTKDKQPFHHQDPRFPDVVFIGDANHAVTPFAGNGANMALNDGWDLADLLCKSSSLAEAIRRYDEIVVPRSNLVWKQSHRNIDLAHSTGWKSWLLMVLFRVMVFVFFRHLVRTDETSEPDSSGP